MATFVVHVTIADDAVLALCTPFTKTWQVNKHWLLDLDEQLPGVLCISGTTMTRQPGYWIVPPEQTVAPGQAMNISIGMLAPVDKGDYESDWGLRSENGPLMAIQGGAHGNSFDVKSNVRNGAASAPDRSPTL